MTRYLLAIGAALAVSTLGAAPQTHPQLVSAINEIRAIDNHAHVVAPDIEHDTAYDALRCDTLPAGTALPPANTRFGPDLQAAWMALYGFSADSASAAQLQIWQNKQRAVRDKLGAKYFDWVAQQAGIDVILANRVVMAPDLDAAHFRWVPYDDALLFPLDNTAAKAANPDRKVLYGAAEQLLHTYMASAGVTAGPPTTLDEYLEKVVAPTLQSQKSHGAVAIKFEAAYLRALDFEPASRDRAANVYARGARGAPDGAEYKLLQDFLFREIAARAGHLGLVVHVHTGSGCGEYFDDRGADPMLLASVLNDPALRGTRFVLLHGGSPFDRRIIALIVKPNAWVDTSVLEFMFSPAEVARIVRPWLETMPERVLFGTDAGPFGPGMGWEETTWMGSRRARQALAIALTQMVADGVVTQARAIEIAQGVLRENARGLYGWQ